MLINAHVTLYLTKIALSCAVAREGCACSEVLRLENHPPIIA